jgi:hypothetical protein
MWSTRVLKRVSYKPTSTLRAFAARLTGWGQPHRTGSTGRRSEI